MDKYEVMLYPRAYRDIHDIYAYIALERLSPETAKEQTDRIWQAIKKLELFPKSHQDRLVGRYAGKEYKQLIIDNYIAIFKVDENKKKVFVLNSAISGKADVTKGLNCCTNTLRMIVRYKRTQTVKFRLPVSCFVKIKNF